MLSGALGVGRREPWPPLASSTGAGPGAIANYSLARKVWGQPPRPQRDLGSWALLVRPVSRPNSQF